MISSQAEEIETLDRQDHDPGASDETASASQDPRPGNAVAISVIVPTYNEAVNIGILAQRIAGILAGQSFEMIVVDDDSADQTWQRVEELAQTRPWLRCHRRIGRRGLSSAILEGLLLGRGDALLVIDADLQHDPEIAPRLIAGLEQAEVAVATRYASGGGIGDWTWKRWFASRSSTIFVQCFLGTTTSDPMSGYFAVRRSLVLRIAAQMKPRGYKLLMELLYRGQVGKVVEVPYVFGLRMHGESKIHLGVAWDFIASMWDLRFGSVVSRRFLEYCVVGSSGLAVQLLATHVLRQIPVLRTPDSAIATALAILCAMISNYCLNNMWVFSDVHLRRGRAWLAGFARFSLVCGTGAVVNWLVTIGVRHAADMRINLYYGQLIGIAVATIWNYSLNRQFTWKTTT